jgi:hypothetical protein
MTKDIIRRKSLAGKKLTEANLSRRMSHDHAF